jgi:hypothetical protein
VTFVPWGAYEAVLDLCSELVDRLRLLSNFSTVGVRQHFRGKSVRAGIAGAFYATKFNNNAAWKWAGGAG